MLLALTHSAALLLATLVPPAIIVNTTPKSSPLRVLWLPPYVFSATHFITSLASVPTPLLLVEMIMYGQLLIVLLHTLSCLAIARRDAHDLSRVAHRASHGFVSKTLLTVCFFLGPRNLGAPWQSRQPPPFPGSSGASPPGKARFLLRQLLILSWQYLLMEIVSASGRDTPAHVSAEMFATGSEYRYLSATPLQWIGRLSMGAAWLAPGRVTVDMLYRAGAVVAVASGFDSPKAWPPLFGSVRDAYTLRGFWGNYWHQYCRVSLTSISNWLARDVLRLPRPSLPERYTNILLVFTLSGLFHVVCDWLMQIPLDQTGGMTFFPAFALGIMLEDGVQELWRRLGGGGTKGVQPLWHRLVGYVWVAFWFVMTSAWYIHPFSRLDPHHARGPAPIVVSRLGLPGAQALLVGWGLLLKFGLGGVI